NTCKENIANWEAEIAQLYTKIGLLECQIADEKAKQKSLESQAAAITKEAIDKEALAGIEHFSGGKVMEDAITRLT
ncbi:hypothetical protein A2U01_0099541, partial [Trifolium medium]|nr:hypothetical protein [Trifolium medium]